MNQTSSPNWDQQAAKLTAAFLVAQVRSSTISTCWAFPGYPASILGPLLQGLSGLPNLVIKIHQAYRDEVDFFWSPDPFLDPRTESFTQFRHLFEGTTILVPRETHGEEWESLESVQTLDSSDLLKRLPDFVNLIDFHEVLADHQIANLKTLMEALGRHAESSLFECLRYLLEIRDHLQDTVRLPEALGLALPQLGAFADRKGFRNLKIEGLFFSKSKGRLQESLKQLVLERRLIATRQAHGAKAKTQEELEENLEALIREGDLSVESQEILRRFVKEGDRNEEARRAALRLDWEGDQLQALFRKKKQVRTRMGKATRDFLIGENQELDPEQLVLLDELDQNNRNLSEPFLEQLTQFHHTYEHFLGRDTKLGAKWRKLLYQREIQDPDLFVALLRTTENLLSNTEPESNAFPLKLRVTADQKPVDIFEKLAHDAVVYFLCRYRKVGAFLEDAGVIWDDSSLQRVEKRLHEHLENPNTKNHDGLDLVKFIEKPRKGREANQLRFKVELENALGEKLGSPLFFSWTFPKNSFLWGLPDDLNCHRNQPLSSYSLGRSLVSTKGGRPPISLETIACVTKTSERPAGRLAMAQGFGKTDVGLQIHQLLHSGELGRLAKPVAVYESLLDELSACLALAYQGFLDAGPGWTDWQDFAQRYQELIEAFQDPEDSQLFRRKVLLPLSTLGCAEIRGEQAVIVGPLHPLRLLAIWTKAHQVKQTLGDWLTSADNAHIDRDFYCETLCRDLAHPYYPEIIAQDQKLYVPASQLVDYSLFTPVEVKAADVQERASDPKKAITCLRGVISDFLALHPFEVANLTILTHSISSESFLPLLVNELAKSSDAQAPRIRARLLIRDQQVSRLRQTYRTFLKSLDREGLLSLSGEGNVSFLSRLGVTAYQEELEYKDGDVDIVFLFHFVSERTTVRWQAVEPHEQPLASFFPARWGRRQVYIPGSENCGLYLCAPVNPSQVNAYYQLIKAGTTTGNHATHSLPLRCFEYGNPDVENILKQCHAMARWVVHFDAILDRRLLDRRGTQIIRYRPSTAFSQNLTVSSTKGDLVVRRHLEHKLLQLGLWPTDGSGPDLLSKLIQASGEISGELLLRAMGQGKFTQELLGAVLSRELARHQLSQHERESMVWIYLDDYAAWFKGGDTLSGDLDLHRRGLADLLGFSVTQHAAGFTLRLILIETKFLDARNPISGYKHHSLEQLIHTYEKLVKLLKADLYRDGPARLLHLGNMLVEAGRFEKDCPNPETVRNALLAGQVTLVLEGQSHIFSYGTETEPSVHCESERNLRQYDISLQEIRGLLASLLNPQRPLPIPTSWVGMEWTPLSRSTKPPEPVTQTPTVNRPPSTFPLPRWPAEPALPSTVASIPDATTNPEPEPEPPPIPTSAPSETREPGLSEAPAVYQAAPPIPVSLPTTSHPAEPPAPVVPAPAAPATTGTSPLPSRLMPRAVNPAVSNQTHVPSTPAAAQHNPQPYTPPSPTTPPSTTPPNPGAVPADEALQPYSWASPEIAELLRSLPEPPSISKDQDHSELETLKQSLKRFFPRYDIPFVPGECQMTPNTCLIRFKGSHDLSRHRIWKLEDPLLTTERLALLAVDSEPGYFVLSFARKNRQIVPYQTCLRHRLVNHPKTNTRIILGCNERKGDLHYYDCEQVPHALIGGMTGSGKSQLMQTMILDLMLTNTPDHLKIVLVDPKCVEFMPYHGSPFLKGIPCLSSNADLFESAIVHTPDLAITVLEALVNEMERRYFLFSQAGTSDIRGYNRLELGPTLPRLVMIFDEVADWMLDRDFQKEVTRHFSRLAGKARASGIHLFLATQRPDATVVPPILRANLGAKLALKVDKRANSEIILDEPGAERLLGNGHGIARINGPSDYFQGAFLSGSIRDLILEGLQTIYGGRP